MKGNTAGKTATFSVAESLSNETTSRPIPACGPRQLCIFTAILILHNIARAQQPISPYVIGNNAYMPPWRPAENPSGQVEHLWDEMETAKFQTIRVGGNDAMSDNDIYRWDGSYRLLYLVNGVRSANAEPIVQIPDGYSVAKVQGIYKCLNVTNNCAIKLWSIGNEPDLHGRTASEICDYIKRISSALKAMDPNAIVMGPDLGYYNNAFWDPLLGGAADITGKDASGRYYIDVVAWHRYELNEIDDLEQQVTLMSARLRTINATRPANKQLSWAITEMNMHFSNAEITNPDQYPWTFHAGQLFAEIYDLMMRKNGFTLCPWCMHEGSGDRSTSGTDLSLFDTEAQGFPGRSAYYHSLMLGQNMKTAYLPHTDNQDDVVVIPMGDGTGTAVMLVNRSTTTGYSYALRMQRGAFTDNTRTLQVTVDAGIGMEITGFLDAETTRMFVFNSQGQLVKRYTYSKTQSDQRVGPVVVTTGLDSTCRTLGQTSLVGFSDFSEWLEGDADGKVIPPVMDFPSISSNPGIWYRKTTATSSFVATYDTSLSSSVPPIGIGGSAAARIGDASATAAYLHVVLNDVFAAATDYDFSFSTRLSLASGKEGTDPAAVGQVRFSVGYVNADGTFNSFFPSAEKEVANVSPTGWSSHKSQLLASAIPAAAIGKKMYLRFTHDAANTATFYVWVDHVQVNVTSLLNEEFSDELIGDADGKILPPVAVFPAISSTPDVWHKNSSLTTSFIASGDTTATDSIPPAGASAYAAARVGDSSATSVYLHAALSDLYAASTDYAFSFATRLALANGTAGSNPNAIGQVKFMVGYVNDDGSLNSFFTSAEKNVANVSPGGWASQTSTLLASSIPADAIGKRMYIRLLHNAANTSGYFTWVDYVHVDAMPPLDTDFSVEVDGDADGNVIPPTAVFPAISSSPDIWHKNSSAETSFFAARDTMLTYSTPPDGTMGNAAMRVGDSTASTAYMHIVLSDVFANSDYAFSFSTRLARANGTAGSDPNATGQVKLVVGYVNDDGSLGGLFSNVEKDVTNVSPSRWDAKTSTLLASDIPAEAIGKRMYVRLVHNAANTDGYYVWIDTVKVQ